MIRKLPTWNPLINDNDKYNSNPPNDNSYDKILLEPFWIHSRRLRIFALTTFTNFRTCILLRTVLNSVTTFTNLRSILLSMFITKTQCVIQNTPLVIYYLVYLALKDTKDYYIIFLLNPSFSIHCLNGEISNICMRHFWSMHVIARAAPAASLSPSLKGGTYCRVLMRTFSDSILSF